MSENPAGLNQAAMQALGAGDFATAQALTVRPLIINGTMIGI